MHLNHFHQFSASKFRKVSTPSLFNVFQGPQECLRDYPARFIDVIVKVVSLNQDLFVGAF